MTDEIQIWGLWQTEEEVDSGVIRIKKKTEKVKALKSQLRFRKTVLLQKVKDCPKVYQFTKNVNGNSTALSVVELSNNLKKLVRHAYTVSEDIAMNNEQPIIVGQKIKHAFIENGETVWYTGQVISQVYLSNCM